MIEGKNTRGDLMPMLKIMESINNIRLLDDLARQGTVIHRIHPLVKLLTTLVYLLVVVSYGKYEVSPLLPLLLYPVLIFALGELPLKPILTRVLLVEPLVIGVGILNPFFDPTSFWLGEIQVSRGWLTFLAIVIKGSLTVTAALLLIATTGMDSLAAALRMLRVPRIFVLQLLLTYRYITVLLEEVGTVLRAYAMRAPQEKGVRRSAWGSLAGQILIRTYERAQRVYQAMSLRGFKGEYHSSGNGNIQGKDLLYLSGWVLFFLVVRMFDLPGLLGSILTGVFSS